ncbi:CST complex subunit CTC1-like isoform X2 [Carica papaya]|uniref:CST complex subunit CTC1-like isoform X2 n=1 Tax=Carica papaya TaxID=3649 RepID=UPI000B8C6E6C|nr:CST complex subunit CTC1-like isoform X2 [Carica papaya]
MYINSHLSSSMFQDRHGVFVEFCRHESCGCNSEIYCSNLKLVVPFSTFIHHGEAKWMKMLLRSEKNNIFCDNNCSRLFSLEEKSYSPSKRRILISEDLGFVLLGHLKIAASGRLQLLDGTGSIDVIISDLRPAWEENSIYELLDYRLIVDGIPELVDHLKLLRKSITCRSVFHCLPVTRERAASPMFIDLSLRGSKCRNIPFYSSLEWKNDLCEFESGAFHLFLVTHKFPALLNSGQMRSNISSTFVEAIILPWDLTLAGKDGAVHLAKFSRNQISEQMEHYAIESNEHAPIKKQRTSNLTDKELTSGFLNDNLGSEFKTSCSYGDDTQTHGCGNLSNSREIRCMATVRCVNNSNLVTSGILYHAKLSAKVNVNGKPHAEKVLLQFQSESSAKYHIGGYYIMKHHIEDSFCKVKKIYEVNSARVLSSTSRIWSLCLSFDYAFTSNKSIHDTVMGDSSFNRNDILLAEQDELLLQGAPGSSPGTFSDVSLHLPSDAIDILHVKLKELEENLIKPAIKPEEAYNFLSSRTHLHSMPSGSYSNCLFPEGNLVSLNGDVIAIHGLGLCTPSVQSNCEDPNNVLQLRFLQGHGSSCIHVMVDHQTVKISGFLSRHTYLTGFGPGTNATFHRILEVGGQDRLMLTPISFIVINSLRVVDDLYSERWSSFPASAVHGTSSVETISFGLISELIPKCMDYKPVRFLCKVIAINLLVLEKFEKYDNSKSSIQSRPVPIDIPLAGFVLDDGSSTCFCWANAERAATLLRLREELPQTVLEYCGCTLKWVGIDKTARGSIMYHLGRILEKHKRITVKTHGSMADSSFPELTVFASSDNKLTSSDENLLKFIVLHACFCISWTVVACMMDPDAVRHLEREHLVEVKTVHSVKNMWAREVCHTNSLTEARNIIQELLNR